MANELLEIRMNHETYAVLLMRVADILDSLQNRDNPNFNDELDYLSIEIRGLATILINNGDILSKSFSLIERLIVAFKIIFNK